MINELIEKLHDKWYDNRKGMPPGSFESYLAGWLDAIKHQARQAKSKDVVVE